MNPENPASVGISSRALKMVNPASAKKDRERLHRTRALASLSKDIQTVTELPKKGVLGPFRENWEKGSRQLVRISLKEINSLVTKWVQGTHFLLHDRMILPSSVSIYHLQKNDADIVAEQLRQISERCSVGPCIQITHATAINEGNRLSFYRFDIWEQFWVLASVEEPNARLNAHSR